MFRHAWCKLFRHVTVNLLHFTSIRRFGNQVKQAVMIKISSMSSLAVPPIPLALSLIPSAGSIAQKILILPSLMNAISTHYWHHYCVTKSQLPEVIILILPLERNRHVETENFQPIFDLCDSICFRHKLPRLFNWMDRHGAFRIRRHNNSLYRLNFDCNFRHS